MRLHILNSGYLVTNEMNVVNDESARDLEVEIPIPFNLIEHPEGLVLFDGGNALEVAYDPIKHWGDVAKDFKVVMTEDDFVTVQLEKMGIIPEDIKYVVQSHLHMDHTGALGYFPNATVIVQKKELQYALNPDFFQEKIYQKNDIARESNWSTLNGFKNDNFDLFGDGKIRILYTPGHTAGHQSLLLDLPETGKVVLAGDALHRSRGLDKYMIPAAGLYYNAKDYVMSVNRLRMLREQGCKIFVGHDPGEWAKNTVLN